VGRRSRRKLVPDRGIANVQTVTGKARITVARLLDPVDSGHTSSNWIYQRDQGLVGRTAMVDHPTVESLGLANASV